MNQESRIIDYLTGQLSDNERLTFEKQLAVDIVLEQEVEEVRQMWQLLQTSEKQPDATMDNAFYAMLAQQKGAYSKPKNIHVFHNQWFRMAAAVAGFGLAFGIGRLSAPERIREIVIQSPKTEEKYIAPTTDKNVAQIVDYQKINPENKAVDKQISGLQKEMKLTQELLILSLLKNQSSASDRLEGLYVAQKLEKPNAKLLEELINVLRKDDNVNVRLSAIEVLTGFGKNPKTTHAMISQLAETDEPMEQINLIGSLVKLRATESISILSKIEQNQEMAKEVKTMAKMGINQLLYESNNQIIQ